MSANELNSDLGRGGFLPERFIKLLTRLSRIKPGGTKTLQCDLHVCLQGQRDPPTHSHSASPPRICRFPPPTYAPAFPDLSQLASPLYCPLLRRAQREQGIMPICQISSFLSYCVWLSTYEIKRSSSRKLRHICTHRQLRAPGPMFRQQVFPWDPGPPDVEGLDSPSPRSDGSHSAAAPRTGWCSWPRSRRSR